MSEAEYRRKLLAHNDECRAILAGTSELVRAFIRKRYRIDLYPIEWLRETVADLEALLAAARDPVTETEAERTVKSIAAMLGWMHVPPRELLEADIRALKSRAVREPVTELRELIGWLSADIPELHHVGVPRLAESLERFLVRSKPAAEGASSPQTGVR